MRINNTCNIYRWENPLTNTTNEYQYPISLYLHDNNPHPPLSPTQKKQKTKHKTQEKLYNIYIYSYVFGMFLLLFVTSSTCDKRCKRLVWIASIERHVDT
jgi:hypothetical protein